MGRNTTAVIRLGSYGFGPGSPQAGFDDTLFAAMLDEQERVFAALRHMFGDQHEGHGQTGHGLVQPVAHMGDGIGGGHAVGMGDGIGGGHGQGHVGMGDGIGGGHGQAVGIGDDGLTTNQDWQLVLAESFVSEEQLEAMRAEFIEENRGVRGAEAAERRRQEALGPEGRLQEAQNRESSEILREILRRDARLIAEKEANQQREDEEEARRARRVARNRLVQEVGSMVNAINTQQGLCVSAGLTSPEDQHTPVRWLISRECAGEDPGATIQRAGDVAEAAGGEAVFYMGVTQFVLQRWAGGRGGSATPHRLQFGDGRGFMAVVGVAMAPDAGVVETHLIAAMRAEYGHDRVLNVGPGNEMIPNVRIPAFVYICVRHG